MERDNKASVEFFRRPNIIWFLIIIPAMVYLSILAYVPEVIPFNKLGPLGDLSQYLNKNQKILVWIICWSAWALHFFEAVFVVRRAKDMNVNAACRNKWFFQTLLVGYPSTRLMNRYYNKHKTN